MTITRIFLPKGVLFKAIFNSWAFSKGNGYF